jgi:hypothetical protein
MEMMVVVVMMMMMMRTLRTRDVYMNGSMWSYEHHLSLPV